MINDAENRSYLQPRSVIAFQELNWLKNYILFILLQSINQSFSFTSDNIQAHDGYSTYKRLRVIQTKFIFT